MNINNLCNGAMMPTSLPYCCPSNFYIKDNTGCTFCNGNIFLFIDTQVCCPFGYSFNTMNGTCSYCSGLLDASFTICCSKGSYIHYDASGNARCDTLCSVDNLYQAKYCCDGLTGGCSNTYSATSCNPSYYIPNSCMSCPGFCSSNSQICSTSQSACFPACRAT